MNLIANTGIQLMTVPLEVDMDNKFRMYFHQWVDTSDYAPKLELEIAHYFSDDDVWVRKHHLSELGYAPGGVVNTSFNDIRSDDEFDESQIIRIDTDDPLDSGCFSISASSFKPEEWAKFENIWLPMPFFSLIGKKTEFGPTNWCRFKLIPKYVLPGGKRKYDILIAFDTKSGFEQDDTDDSEDLKEYPVFTNAAEQEKRFSLCRDEYNLLTYLSGLYNTDWVDKYLLKIFHGVEDIDKVNNLKKPKLKYMALYIYLIRFIKNFANIEDVVLKTDHGTPVGKVDLVIDVGNSRTCAVLFDNGDFTKSTPLELLNFTEPIKNGTLNKVHTSFDMRLAFRKADLGGDFGINDSRQFTYPSLVRLGPEANQLIHMAANLKSGSEKTSTYSSPKRFLWDMREQKQEWEFVTLPDEDPIEFYINGITEQLNNDGSLNTEGDGGRLMHYSRRSLMSFSFLEILAQANMQINSPAQRAYWGNEFMPRKVERIIVTCPTAMSKVEQVELRKCAEDAAVMLNRFFDETYVSEIDETELRQKVKVIPSAKKLSKQDVHDEWIFDEATAVQFVFAYAEISERYGNDFKKYFDLYGKKRDDLDGYDKKAVTIGSVDIGAGTTDVMIASYKYAEGTECILTPVPLFWESFYKAGDDLMKEIIHQMVIEGPLSPLEAAIKQRGGNPVNYLQPFLGTDNGIEFRKRQLRSDFNLQVSVPIASLYLELLKKDEVESKKLSFNDVFADNMPTEAVLDYFNDHFGFRLESIVWEYNRDNVSAIIRKTFDNLMGKISSLFSYYHCDFVLMSGRPTSLKPLTDLFLDYYSISPNRLKTMNDYRVGRWYPQDDRFPFIDANGMFLNPKSIVTTGAIIGHIAGNGGLHGFSLDLSELKKKLLPATNFFGKLDANLNYVGTFISPDCNNAKFQISSLPFRIGVRQKDHASYPSRPFFTLSFDDYRIEDRVRGRFDDDVDDGTVAKAMQDEKDKILSKMPLQISVSRDFYTDIEDLKLEEVTDMNGNPLSTKMFLLQVQSLSEEENFWLDSGLFDLNVRV